FLSDDPTSGYYRVSRARSPQLHLMLLLTSLGVFAITVIAALARLLGGRGSAGLPDRPLLVALSASFLFAVGVLVGLQLARTAILHDQLGGVRIVLAIVLVGAALTIAAAGVTVQQWRRGIGSLSGRIRFTAVVLVALVFLWSLRTWNLLGWRI